MLCLNQNLSIFSLVVPKNGSSLFRSMGGIHPKYQGEVDCPRSCQNTKAASSRAMGKNNSKTTKKNCIDDPKTTAGRE